MEENPGNDLEANPVCYHCQCYIQTDTVLGAVGNQLRYKLCPWEDKYPNTDRYI